MNEVTYQQTLGRQLWKIKTDGKVVENNPEITVWNCSITVDDRLIHTATLGERSGRPLAPALVLLNMISMASKAAQYFMQAELIPPVNVGKLELVVDCDASKPKDR